MAKAHTIPRGPLWAMLGLATSLVALLAFSYGQFRYVSVCVVCGLAQDGVDYQAPQTRWTYYRWHQEYETTLSQVLTKNQFVSAHTHQWQMVIGDGNGVPKLLGDGHLVATSLISPSMGPFIDSMLHWTDRETTEGWVARLRNPGDAQLCRTLSELCQNEQFGSREEWERWLVETESRISPKPL